MWSIGSNKWDKVAKLNWKMSQIHLYTIKRALHVLRFLQQFHYCSSEIQSQSITRTIPRNLLTNLLWRVRTNKSKTRGLGDTTHVVFCSFIRRKIKVGPPDQSLRQHSRNDTKQIERRGNDSFLTGEPSSHGNSKKIYHVIKLFIYIFQKKVKWHRVDSK